MRLAAVDLPEANDLTVGIMALVAQQGLPPAESRLLGRGFELPLVLMGSHKDRPQITRLEVVDMGRRRRWSEAEKQRIIEESFSGRRLVSATARAHGISRSLLTTWRRLYRKGRLEQNDAVSFAPVLLAETPLAAGAALGSPAPRVERIEIVLMNGRRILVGKDVDVAALARVVSVLERA